MAVRRRLLPCLLAAGLALAGCGVSAAPGAPGASASAGASASRAAVHRSAQAAVSGMRIAVRDASSVHVTGVLSDNGKPVGINLGVLRTGQLSGTITENGVPLTIIATGGKAYVKATPAFLRELKEPPGVCTLMCGKYVETTGQQERQLAGSLSMPSLLHSFTGRMPAYTSAGTSTTRGQQVQVLHGADGSVLEVAAPGTPYPLRVVSPPSRHGSVEFTQWNSVPAPAPPPASQLIDPAQLHH